MKSDLKATTQKERERLQLIFIEHFRAELFRVGAWDALRKCVSMALDSAYYVYERDTHGTT